MVRAYIYTKISEYLHHLGADPGVGLELAQTGTVCANKIFSDQKRIGLLYDNEW